jgi:hypothetical protein
MNTQKITLTYGSNTITIPANSTVTMREIISSAGDVLSVNVDGQYAMMIHRNGGGVEMGNMDTPVNPGESVDIQRTSGTKG